MAEEEGVMKKEKSSGFYVQVIAKSTGLRW